MNLKYKHKYLLMLVLVSGLWFVAKKYEISQKIYSTYVTNKYVGSFNQSKYEILGADYFNLRYSPLRLNKPLVEIDRTYDYDFSQLAKVEEYLNAIDRKKALEAIFNKITANAKSNLEKHLFVLRFIHKATHHGPWLQPVYKNKMAVMDPLVLLELGSMRCGAVARLGADLFAAAGFKTRIVQLASHVTAEIYYDGGWHLFEGNLFGGGQTIFIGGKIPSIADISKQPFSIDKIPTRTEIRVSLPVEMDRHSSVPYPSYFYFSKAAYQELKPLFYYKEASEKQASKSKLYGWEYYKTVQMSENILQKFPAKYEPGPPRFKSVILTDNKVNLEWEPSIDGDNDLIGYKVFVSSKSRGWNYQYFTGGESAKKYWKGGWSPSMYNAMYQSPPHDKKLIETKKTSVMIDLKKGEKIFVTVMPIDKHGMSVGRTLYDVSEELELQR